MSSDFSTKNLQIECPYLDYLCLSFTHWSFLHIINLKKSFYAHSFSGEIFTQINFERMFFMCGIAGWLNFERDISDNEKIFNAMSDTIIRRGPDAGGAFISKNAALIHRRLAVVDLEGGAQPMYKTHNGREYIIVYNGEIYNSDELRHELTDSGIAFKTHSDTEAVLSSYIIWGNKCPEHLNGIFAFAIYDKYRRELFCARDRAGVKPFFYHLGNDGLIFGSEISTLLAHPSVPHTVDSKGIGEIFLIGPGRTPGRSAFSSISELKPGECAVYNKSGLKKQFYWKLSAAEHTDNADETAEKIRFLLTDSIKRQLVSDVPLCCFLSGGLDSSIISSVAAGEYRQSGMNLTTYSVDYVDNDKYFKANAFQPNSDDHYIDIMSNDIKSSHKKVVLDNNDVADALYPATLARSLPGMAEVDSSLLLFCREVKKTHTVAVSGECADEIFGGYPWYSNPDVLFSDDFPWSGNTQTKSKLISEKFLNFDPTEFVYQRYLETVRSAPKTGSESKIDSRIKEVTMLNLKWFMQTLLDRKDRMSMYSGLEVRVPFCDHRIMEYAYNIPWEIKALHGREKGLLRKAFEGILPDEIIKRKKSPYPKSHNPVYINNVIEKVITVLNDNSAPIWEIANRNFVKEILDTQGSAFSRPWYGQLMNFPQIMAYIYSINVWLKSFVVDIKNS